MKVVDAPLISVANAKPLLKPAYGLPLRDLMIARGGNSKTALHSAFYGVQFVIGKQNISAFDHILSCVCREHEIVSFLHGRVFSGDARSGEPLVV